MFGWGKRVTDETKKRELAVAFARNQAEVAERERARLYRREEPPPAVDDGPLRI